MKHGRENTMTGNRSRSTAATVAVLSCCCCALLVVAPRACHAQEERAPVYGMAAVTPLDITGSLMRSDQRIMPGLSALNSLDAPDPLADFGFRGGRRIDWSRLPAMRLLRGLIHAAAADRTRMGMRSNFYRADEGHLTAGFVYQRGLGGVGMNWSF